MAIAFFPRARPSDDDLVDLGRRNPAYRFERGAGGELIVSPPAGLGSSMRNAELARQLGEWNRRFGDGVVFDSSGGFSLPNGALLSPDAAWVERARWEALVLEERERFATLCPSAIFELLSRGDDRAKVLSKIGTFLKAGARLAVLLDPYDAEVTVFSPAPTRHVAPVKVALPRAAFPGARRAFVLDVAALFGT